MFAVVPLLFQQPRVNTREARCRNNLKQIGLGLQIYADIHGCFPPAYIADESGKPMHSWRVLILPYMERGDLYAKYDFNEPWNGPHNRLLAKSMPSFYSCPSDVPLPVVTTSYLAVTGPQTAWPGNASSTFLDLADGTSNTIGVVEVAGSGVNWMEPRDLPFAALKNGVNPKAGLSIRGHHGCAQCVFLDGHTSWLQDSTPVATLEALATRAGGETITGDY